MESPSRPLGFTWQPSPLFARLPVHPVERACSRFQESLPTLVWNAAALENNPLTLLEVQALLAGAALGAHRSSDQNQVLNLANSAKYLLALVKRHDFTMSKSTFTALHGLVAREEALEWGVFRGEGQEHSYTPAVALGPSGSYHPLPTLPGAPRLNQLFATALPVFASLPPAERALAFFLFGALHQFFFDGNKRTSRFMMNGILLSSGIDGISIPAARATEFNQKMVRFYQTKDGTEMMHFVLSCHPDAHLFLPPPAGSTPRPL